MALPLRVRGSCTEFIERVSVLLTLAPSYSVWRMFESAVAQGPLKPALIFESKAWTYQALHQEANAIAAALVALGIKKGDCVAIWLPNVPFWITLFLACTKIGAPVLALNTRFKSKEVGDVLARAEAKVLVYSPHFLGIDFSALINEIDPVCLKALSQVFAWSPEASPPTKVAGLAVWDAARLLEFHPFVTPVDTPDSACVMFTTSGTTSRPKLVLHSQRSIAHHAQDVARALGYEVPGSVILVVTPLCGVSGFGVPMACIAAQAVFVLSVSFNTEQSLHIIQSHRITHIHANHEIVRRWLDYEAGPVDFSSLKMVNCGSGIGALIERAKARTLPLLSIYGSSEVQARFSSQLHAQNSSQALEGGGRPLSSLARVRVADIESGESLGPEARGELQICAPSQLMGYFSDSQATQNAITHDGYVRTGDCGYIREDGSFVLEARIGDVLKLSGFMVSPAEIESFILDYEGVLQCQVVGRPTARGLRAVAFVKTQYEFQESNLRDYCRAHMAAYKVPIRIIRLDEFPVTAGVNSPKIQKNALRELAKTINIE